MMAAIRYGGVKAVTLLTRQTRIKHLFKFDASTVPVAKQDRTKLRAWSGQHGVEVPRKKIIPKNAVLESLKDSVAIDWRMNSHYPCETLELAPTTLGAKKNSLQAAQRAKDAVKLLADNSELLADGMSWVGETKADMDYIKIPAGEVETGGQTVSQIIDHLTAKQDLKQFHANYQAMVKDGIEISLESKEKLVASACFITVMNHNSLNQNIKLLEEILALSAPLTKTMLLVVIQCFVEIGNEAQYTKWFERLLENEYHLDSETASSLLKISNSSAFKSKIIDLLKSRGIPPTAAAVFASFPVEDCLEKTNKEIALTLSKYIQEANHCSTNSKLEVLVEALSLVSTKLMNTSIMYALLSRMESFENGKVRNSDGFVHAIVAADKSRDIELAQKIVATACRHCISLPQKFFASYVFCVGKLSTAEVFMENIAGYLGPVVTINGNMFERMVNLCSRRHWPHVLPLLYSAFDNPVLYHDHYTNWLQSASKLVPKADEDCIKQFNTIADVLVNFVKLPSNRSSPEFRDSLVNLMVKCNHQNGLREFLRIADKNPSLKKEYSYSACEMALETVM